MMQVFHIAVLALAAGWLAGCSTMVYKQGDSAAGSSRTAAMEIQTESQALAGTMTTLNDLAACCALGAAENQRCNRRVL